MCAIHQEDVAVTVRSRYFLAGVVGLWMAHTLPGQEPARLSVAQEPARSELAANQQVANTIAANLRQSGQLRQYHIDIAFRDGTAELTGSVQDQPQREEAVRIAQGVPGVERVLDRISVGSAITPVQAKAPMPDKDVPMPEKGPAPRATTPPAASTTGPAGPMGPTGPVGPMVGGYPGMEPAPIASGPAPSPYDLNPPKMPPYAWPTYAPYNNYSRVAYPELYPYNAWPFIGPVYPFPKVPLGWRAVKLEWEDGHWWYKKVPTKHDWWRLRYW
jgi:hypothetical protein